MSSKMFIDIDLVLKKYNNGESASQIAQDLGVAPSTICSRLRESGVVLPRGRKIRLKDEEIITRYLSGESSYQIASDLNVSRGVIDRRLHSSDIEMRLKPLHGRKVIGDLPGVFETSIYVLKRDDVVFYVGSTKNPLDRYAVHNHRGDNVVMYIVRNVSDDKTIVEECREIVYWSDLEFVLENTRVPERRS